jgi:hypothetical protein
MERAGYERLRGMVSGSTYANLKELRVQAKGKPVRVFFAFDPNRTAVLLNGGEKTGDDRFYFKMIAKADTLFAEHLKGLEQ